LQEGPDHEDGRVISEDGRVYRFSLFYDQAAEHGACSASSTTGPTSPILGGPDRWLLEQQTPSLGCPGLPS
jgi:hypothetical protein